MPVISTRRYSSYLTSPTISSSSTTSGLGSGTYRSTNYTSSSTLSSTSLPSSSRYNLSDSSSSYRSSYRSSLSSSNNNNSSSTSANDRVSNSTSTYRSRYDYDDSAYSSKSYDTKSRTDSLISTRIGVSKKNTSNSRYNSTNCDTLPPLPPNAHHLSSTSTNGTTNSSSVLKRSVSRSRDQYDSNNNNTESGTKSDYGVGSSSSQKSGDRTSKVSLMNDLEFYEKYSPSRYMTKYESARSRSLSDATLTTPNRDISPASSTASLNVTPTHTPKSEVIFFIPYLLKICKQHSCMWHFCL